MPRQRPAGYISARYGARVRRALRGKLNGKWIAGDAWRAGCTAISSAELAYAGAADHIGDVGAARLQTSRNDADGRCATSSPVLFPDDGVRMGSVCVCGVRNSAEARNAA